MLFLFLIEGCRWEDAQKALPIFREGYLLTYHHCIPSERDCFDPILHQIGMAHSIDGNTWRVLEDFPKLSGSVPDIFVRDNHFWIYALPESYLLDTATLEIQKKLGVSVFDSNNNRIIQVDPSPIIDEEGRIVLFFLEGIPGIDPARCPQNKPCSKQFLSATERKGSQGFVFDLDEGVRLNLPISGHEFASDPDIFVGRDGLFYMYISRGQGTQVFISKQLRGEYKEQGWLTQQNGGVACGHFDNLSNMFWSYTSKNVPQPWIQEIRYETHDDFDDLQFSKSLFSQDMLGNSKHHVMMHGSPGFFQNHP